MPTTPSNTLPANGNRRSRFFTSRGYNPTDGVKIDRSFIRDLREEGELPLVKSIINLAQGMKLLVVAEGIETATQQTYLTTLGCDYGQGFHIYRPMRIEKLMEII